jgi:hypothetical protein
MIRPCGALPDDPSTDRGEALDCLVAAARAAPGRSASLRHLVDVIPDQGMESSCVGHAIAQCLRVRSRAQGSPIDPSAKAIYALARQLDDPRVRRLRDKGSHPEKAFLGLSDWGAVARARWTDDADVHAPVPIDVLEAGAVARVTGEYTIGLNRRLEIERSLTAGYPIFWVRRVDRAYQSWPGGLYPGLTGEPIGLHAGAIVEYDDLGVWDAGSYGRGIGNGGFVHYSWRFFETSDVRLLKVVALAPLEVA